MSRESSLHNQFKSSAAVPRPGFEKSIHDAVVLRRKRALTVRMSGYFALAAVSVAAAVPAFISLGVQLSQSGFFQYLSLAFSDGGTMWTMAKDFSLLLAESLPVMNIILVAGILMVLAWSIRKFILSTSSSKLFLLRS